MMPQKLLFSIGPPALLPFVCLEKKAVLYLINISEYQGQIKQAATSEFYHSCITHNSNFRTNMMLQRLLFSIALASCFAIVHMLGEEIYLYPINISEHQRQQSKRPARNLSFFGGPTTLILEKI